MYANAHVFLQYFIHLNLHVYYVSFLFQLFLLVRLFSSVILHYVHLQTRLIIIMVYRSVASVIAQYNFNSWFPRIEFCVFNNFCSALPFEKSLVSINCFFDACHSSFYNLSTTQCGHLCSICQQSFSSRTVQL